MLSTYLNDNQGMPYPFYGDGSLPFSMAVIVGLSICIKGNSLDNRPLFANSIMITSDSVRVAICRHRSGDANDTPELIGMFYATTAGYYTYIPSYMIDAVYENQTIEPPELRFVYGDYAPIQHVTVVNGGTVYEQLPDEVIENMQMFYSYVNSAVGVNPARVPSYGHIQLGVIPEDAIGSYIGEFYLDPSCVTYMPDSVYGYHATYATNQDVSDAEQAVSIKTAGLLSLTIDGNTVCVTSTKDSDEASLVSLGLSTGSRITHLNGYGIDATQTVPYPFLKFTDTDTTITWRCLKTYDSAVIIEVNGSNDFPSCYGDD
jgi:hypothetical protein